MSAIAIQAAIAAATSALATAVLIRLAPRLGLVDRPGGRKTHAAPIPLVGGLAILASGLVTSLALLDASATGPFLGSLMLVAVVGAWDDHADLRPRYKFLAQVVACCAMIWLAGVHLVGVGDLLGWRPLWTSWLSIPLTIFAVVGVVNAVNMIDGLDGLASGVAAVALAWFALIAAQTGLPTQAALAAILCGATAGFLIFNLRTPGRSHARAFLGDAGSLLLGFALGWLAVDLTQGPGRRLYPIAALWIVLLPLADCVSLMTRRLRAGKSPFVADNEHIHHYLIARGFTVGQAMAILTGLSAAFGAVGYFGWKLGVPEAALFWPFFFGYFGYHYWIQRAWKTIR